MQEETNSHVSWCIPVIPALGTLKQKKQESESNLGYIGWFYFKKEKKEHVRMYAMHKTKQVSDNRGSYLAFDMCLNEKG
jgi:hypothetical protein